MNNINFLGTVPFSVVSPNSIVNIFMSTNIFIPFDSRCCRSHINDCNLICSDEIKNILTVRERFKLTGDHTIKALI